MIPTVVHGGFGLLGIAIVLQHDARGILMHVNADLARLTDVAAAAVAALHLDGERRRRMPHGTGLRHRMREVCHRKRRLGLPEALEDGQPRVLFPEVKQVGIERLAGGGAIRERAQIVGIHVGLHHHAVHGGRAATAW